LDALIEEETFHVAGTLIPGADNTHGDTVAGSDMTVAA
jgi:hypothetical protein